MKYCITNSTSSVILIGKTLSFQQLLVIADISEDGQVVGGRNTEEKYGLKTLTSLFSFAS